MWPNARYYCIYSQVLFENKAQKAPNPFSSDSPALALTYLSIFKITIAVIEIEVHFEIRVLHDHEGSCWKPKQAEGPPGQSACPTE